MLEDTPRSGVLPLRENSSAGSAGRRPQAFLFRRPSSSPSFGRVDDGRLPGVDTTRSRLKALSLAIVVGGVVLDLATKAWMHDLLQMEPLGPSGREIVLIDGVLKLKGNWNTGITFGALQNGFSTAVLVFTAVASVGIAAWLVFTKTTSRLLHVALSLILAGAVGNLHDRVRWGGVRDFVDFYTIHYPAFNAADSMIVSGVALVLWRELFGRRERRVEGVA
jgi:signal peptidase II